MPEATAVAVADGRIVDVGTLESLAPWMAAREHRVDATFRNKVLLPGFVEPHLHPFLAAKLLTMEIAAPEDWELPAGRVRAVRTRDAFLARLAEIAARRPADASEPTLVWGWHRLWHGDLTRADLDAIQPQAPMFVYHRSYHEVIANTRALELLALTEADVAPVRQHVDLENGHFFETGTALVSRKLDPVLHTPENAARGLALTKALVQRGGVTTVADLSAGITMGADFEWKMVREHLAGGDVPFRTLLVAVPLGLKLRDGIADPAAWIAARHAESTAQLRWPRAVKTLADGAFISQLMRVGPPGYIDGHQGEWITPPEMQRAVIEPFWRDGYDIYCHVNGDEGLDVVLDVLAQLRAATPRDDVRFSLEHFGVSREDQVARLAALGASVSVNGYYLRYFGDAFARNGLGPARADQMTRLGSLARNNVRFAMHSDAPMGPVLPLLAVETAVTRRTAEGTVRGAEQAISFERALRAVTIDAAWNLRLERETGSIAPGKRADFVVLAADPREVPPEEIAEIPIWGTVFEGALFPLAP
jgi:predicted amidohydrolase YtcJ